MSFLKSRRHVFKFASANGICFADSKAARSFTVAFLPVYAEAVPIQFTLPSFAKINLHLQVTGRREDGFHELCTLFQTVSLKDDIAFSEHNDLVLTCNLPGIPTGEQNLILKAAKALHDRFGIKEGARIHLEKRIPSPGGLGGGSSNAAIALLGLCKLWEIEAPFDDLLAIAPDLGSDVPFFLYGGTALGTGRGEKIEQLADIASELLLIVTPPVAVSTLEAFARIETDNLTNEDSNRILQICRFEANSLDLPCAALKNDLETSVFAAYPEVKRVKETLLGLGAVQAQMSGSGGSVFAVFDKEETRQAAMKALETESTWRKFAVAAISRSEYAEALQLVF